MMTDRDVYGRLVLARPPYADEPLWNAESVRGCIVAIMRGPRTPGPVSHVPARQGMSRPRHSRPSVHFPVPCAYL